MPVLLIVARDQPALHRALQHAFGTNQEMAVILDRRVRPSGGAVSPFRATGDGWSGAASPTSRMICASGTMCWSARTLADRMADGVPLARA